MNDSVDLNSIEGRSKARALGFTVPAEADGTAPTATQPDDSGESEKEFQARVILLAKSKGWKCFHVFDSRRSEEGFPDLTLVRLERLIFAELKVKGRKLTPAQLDWINALGVAVATYIWTPSCWPEIQRVLQ